MSALNTTIAPLRDDRPSWIAPTAVLIGRVELGDNTRVLYNSVIRGDNLQVTIGSNTLVQEDCFIRSSSLYGVEIGNHVTIGHCSVLEGCTIQDGVVLGDGVRVLEGAQIGRGARVEPGSVVFQNTVVPPYTFFSSNPGQPIRELTEEEIEDMKKQWKSLVY